MPPAPPLPPAGLQRRQPPLYYGTTKRIALRPGVHADPLQHPPPPPPVPGQPVVAHPPPAPRPALPRPAGVRRPPPPHAGAGLLPPPGAAPPAGVAHSPHGLPPPPPGAAPPAGVAHSPHGLPPPPPGAAPPAGVAHSPHGLPPPPPAAAPPAGVPHSQPGLPPPAAAPPAGVPHSQPGLPPPAAAPPAGVPHSQPGLPPPAAALPGPTVLSCISPAIIKSRTRNNPGITTEPVPSEPIFTFGGVHSKNLSAPGSYNSLGLSIGTHFDQPEPSDLPNFFFGSMSAERLVEVIHDDSRPSSSAATKGKIRQGGRRSRTKGRSRSPSPLPTRSESTTSATTSYAQQAWKASAWVFTPEVNKHKEDLRSYMDEFCGELAQELWETGSYHIKIDFDDLKSKNKQLAYFIANNLKRFQSSLNVIAKRFLLDTFRNKPDDGRYENETVDSCTERFTLVTFTGIPNSICSLESFIAKNKTKRIWLFEGHPDCRHEVPMVNPALRRITQKIVSHVTVGHEDGDAWNGDWSLPDWEIVDGSVVKLLKVPVRLANREMGIRDLEKISTEVIPKLADTDGNLPAFFEHLRKELLTLGNSTLTDTNFYGWFYQYLRFHPALMSSKARSKLLQGFYYAAVRLNCNTFECYDSIFRDSSFEDWVEFVHNDWWTIPEVQWRVFWHGKYPDAETDSEAWMLPYDGYVDSLLNYIRQILEHSNRHCFFNKVQTMVGAFEPELLAADLYPTFLPELIKLMFSNTAMEEFEEGANEFLEEWRFYVKSTRYQGN